MSTSPDELRSACDWTLRVLLGLRAGENFAVWADTHSDPSLIEAMTMAAGRAGAHARTLRLPLNGSSPAHWAPLLACDAVCEVHDGYSTNFFARNILTAARKRVLSMPGITAAGLVRCAAPQALETVSNAGIRLQTAFRKARSLRIESGEGSLTARFDRHKATRLVSIWGTARGSWVKLFDRGATRPGQDALVPGHIAFMPVRATVNGTVAYEHLFRHDQAAPAGPAGIWSLRKGRLSSGTPLEHLSIGLLPSRVFSGVCIEEERAGGSLNVAVGRGIAYRDGIVTRATVWLDDLPILKNGILPAF